MEVAVLKKENLSKVLSFLKEGKVIVFPTDTVYGLICDAESNKAVEKIFKIKKREKTKPLPVFIESIGKAKKVAYINNQQEKFLSKVWPGAVTCILKAKKGLSELVYKEETIALRIPDYKLLNTVLKEFNKPLAQTSANISEGQPTTKIKDVLSQFGESEIQPDLIINAGDLPENNPSKIINLINNQIIRP